MRAACCLEEGGGVRCLGSPAICLEELPTRNSRHSLIPQIPDGIQRLPDRSHLSIRFNDYNDLFFFLFVSLPPPSLLSAATQQGCGISCSPLHLPLRVSPCCSILQTDASTIFPHHFAFVPSASLHSRSQLLFPPAPYILESCQHSGDIT